MCPGTLNLTIYKGITFGPITFTLKDAAGEPVDLTGYTAFADARTSNAASGDPAFSLSPTIVDPAGGVIRIGKTDEETDDLTAGKFTWDFVLENADGERRGPYITGSVGVLNLNTRPPEAP